MAILGKNIGYGAGSLAEGFRSSFFPMQQLKQQRAGMDAAQAEREANRAFQQQQIARQESLMREGMAREDASRQQEKMGYLNLLPGFSQADPMQQQRLSERYTPESARFLVGQAYQQPKTPSGVLGYIQQNFPDMTPQQQLAMYRETMKASAPTTNVYTGDVGAGERPIVDKPAKGIQRIWDAQTNTYRDIPIPGSEQAADAARAAEAAVQKRTQGDIKKQIVVEDIDRIFDIMDKSNVPTVGLGSMFSFIPQTGAADIEKTLNSIRASVGFETLQQMRDSSPTGGALGQVSERENALLQSALGSLDPSLSPEMFRYNLNRVKSLYLDIIHGSGNWNPQTGKPWEGGQIDSGTARMFMQEAGGDKEKARQLARDRGYTF